MKYRFIEDLTSDVFFEAYGKDLKEVFENSAEAMFEIICKSKSIEEKQTIEVEVRGKDEKDLLYNWLQELIAQVDIEGIFFSRFNILEISKDHLKAELHGEPVSMEKGNTVVKAVTYYKFDLKRTEKGYTSTVSLDI